LVPFVSYKTFVCGPQRVNDADALVNLNRYRLLGNPTVSVLEHF